MALLLVLSIAVSAFAAPSTHSVTTSLSASAYKIKPGEKVTFTAVTLKQGSAYKVNWYSDAGEEFGTTSFANGRYTSSLTLKFEEAGDYKIGYTIVMTAGKSGTSFAASAFVYVNVEKPTLTIDQYEIRKWYYVDSDQTAEYPKAAGLLYAVYDKENEKLIDEKFEFYLHKELLYKPTDIDGIKIFLIR